MDSDPLLQTKVHDFTLMAGDAFKGLQYKMILFLIFMFLVITSDVFTNRFLTNFKGAVEHKSATTYGTFIQSLIFAASFIVMDICIDNCIV